MNEIVEGEEDLESEIQESIETQRQDLKELCLDMHLKFEDLKSTKEESKLTVLDLEKCMRADSDRLKAEKKKRLDEFKQYSLTEANLCEKLKEKKIDFRVNVPSEADIITLKQQCKELEKLFEKRKAQMIKLKDEILDLYNDLDISRTESFADMIVFESIDEIPLGNDDIQKVWEFHPIPYIYIILI